MPQTRYDLSNHAARASALEIFFTAKGIRANFISIFNQEDWFGLELAMLHPEIDSPDFQQLLFKLNQTCGTQLPLQSITLQQALLDVIQQATTDNIFNITACKSLLASCFNFDSISFDLVTGELSVSIASPAIAEIFKTLKHSQLHITHTQLSVKLYDYLSTHSAAIFIVNKGEECPPSLFLNNQFFPKEQLLLNEEPQADGSIRVTPYMLVPPPINPPNYHFVLDHSPSMAGERLQTAKYSLLTFAKILFQFEPNAQLFINTFNDDYTPLQARPFLQTDSNNGVLAQAINEISTSGSTNIAKACLMKIREFSNNQNNVILFTDGKDVQRDHTALGEELATLTEEQKIKNKFFIISFVEQPQVLQDLTRAFGSQLFVETTTQLQEVLARHDQLQNWVASRDLFTTRVQIRQIINDETVQAVYTSALMQSNQVAALPSFSVRPGDKVHIEVRDSFHRTVLTADQTISAIAAPPNTPMRTASTRPLSPGANSMFHHCASDVENRTDIITFGAVTSDSNIASANGGESTHSLSDEFISEEPSSATGLASPLEGPTLRPLG